ncbi:Lipoate-protein ligase A [Porphyridium purpureum]|uniref:Lipoate-protein ligase A n=1 Tax=Porphyridium purpureum TaxID=35688 RepID=A0A5J4YN55_PORPP|nr:Lipoate-protein ligase A [Porphyridium purpureum]|eukprot:POR6563..scf249_10
MGTRVATLRGSTDPFRNLAVEEWLLGRWSRKAAAAAAAAGVAAQEQVAGKGGKNGAESHAPRFGLLLYVNAPCVVIGRMQNPFKEADLAFLARQRIPLLRRRSGGGAVFHDLGNLNYCFVQSREDLDRSLNAQIVARALVTAFGVPASANPRGDILLDGRKASGCAQRITGDMSYHHGTLLVRSDLAQLWRTLSSPWSKVKARATDSVRSVVANLSDFVPDVTHQLVIEALAQEFWRVHGETSDLSVEEIALDALPKQEATFIADEAATLASPDWIVGATLPFSVPLHASFAWGELSLDLMIGRGATVVERVEQISVRCWTHREETREELAQAISNAWTGAPFSGAELAHLLVASDGEPSHGDCIQDIAAWIHDQVPPLPGL